jgi:hypothetical protein
MGSLAACKKDTKSQVPAALIGKWYIRQYSITASTSASTDPPYVVSYGDTSTLVYYQFNNDGTGLEKTSNDPNFINIPATDFIYHVAGNDITFSHNSDIMIATNCTYEMPNSNTLIIRGNYSYPSAAGTVNNLQVLTLSK